jgi:hypothetical protein
MTTYLTPSEKARLREFLAGTELVCINDEFRCIGQIDPAQILALLDEIEALRVDAARLDALAIMSSGVRKRNGGQSNAFVWDGNYPTYDAGREVNLRQAIDAAMLASGEG